MPLLFCPWSDVVLMSIVDVYCVACGSVTYDGCPLRRYRVSTQSCSVTLRFAACLWRSVSLYCITAAVSSYVAVNMICCHSSI